MSESVLNHEGLTRRRRVLALGLVLAVSFAGFILNSVYGLLFSGATPITPQLQGFRILAAMVSETTSLLVLWYVLSEQRRTWKSIGWNPTWLDILRGTGLLLVTLVTVAVTTMLFQLGYHSYAGHYLHARPFQSMLALGVSALSLALVVLNPLFEELIVRGFTMSEIIDLGGSPTLAILVSTGVQMSYHLYEGVLAGAALTAVFMSFSVYFSRTRRIAPIIFAHFCLDAFALLRRTF